MSRLTKKFRRVGRKSHGSSAYTWDFARWKNRKYNDSQNLDVESASTTIPESPSIDLEGIRAGMIQLFEDQGIDYQVFLSEAAEAFDENTDELTSEETGEETCAEVEEELVSQDEVAAFVSEVDDTVS